MAIAPLYPSKVFPTYPELGNRDLIDEVSRECRRVGIHLYCYCILAGGWDRSLVNDPRYSPYMLHGADGKPDGERNTGYGNVEEIMTCGTGDPYRQMIRKLVPELCAHDIDGIYFDAPSGYRSVCFCESCRDGFKKVSGMDLDRLRNVRRLEHAACRCGYDGDGRLVRLGQQTYGGGSGRPPPDHPREREIHALPQRGHVEAGVISFAVPDPRRLYGGVERPILSTAAAGDDGRVYGSSHPQAGANVYGEL